MAEEQRAEQNNPEGRNQSGELFSRSIFDRYRSGSSQLSAVIEEPKDTFKDTIADIRKEAKEASGKPPEKGWNLGRLLGRYFGARPPSETVTPEAKHSQAVSIGDFEESVTPITPSGSRSEEIKPEAPQQSFPPAKEFTEESVGAQARNIYLNPDLVAHVLANGKNGAKHEEEMRKTSWLKTPPVIEGIKSLWSKFRPKSSTSEKPSAEGPTDAQKEEVIQKSRSRILKANIFGFPLSEIVWGIVLGAGSRQLVKTGASIAGFGGFPVAVAAGGVAGGILAVRKEAIRQQKENPEAFKLEEAKNLKQILGNEFRRIGRAKKSKLIKAGAFGIAKGAVGGIIGFSILDVLANEGSELKQFAAGVKVPEGLGIRLEGLRGWAQDQMSPEGAWRGPTRVLGESSQPPIQQEITPPAPEATTPPLTIVEPSASSKEVIPNVIEEKTLQSEQTVWGEIENYWQQNLGRPPTPLEHQNAISRMLSENGIVDARKIPAGTVLNYDSVNEYLSQIIDKKPPLSLEIAQLPDTMVLPQGSNPWEFNKDILELVTGEEPSNSEVYKATYEYCRINNISVPSWNLPTGVNHLNIPSAPYKIPLGIYQEILDDEEEDKILKFIRPKVQDISALRKAA